MISDILNTLMDQAEERETGEHSAAFKLLEIYGSDFLNSLSYALQQEMSKELLDDALNATVRLSAFIPASNPELLRTAAAMIMQPAKRVSNVAKKDLLRIMLKTIPHVDLRGDMMNVTFPAVCSSFVFFADRDSRQLLCNILDMLAIQRPDLKIVAELCQNLNAFSSFRLDEPDFDRRSQAFNKINEEHFLQLTSDQWRPLLANMMFFVKDAEELTIRASASHSIRRCIEATANQAGDARKEFLHLLQTTMIPGIERGARDQPETVRAEYLVILACALHYLSDWSLVSGLKSLTDTDDEASILLNILHIQHHRRVRALQRLAAECAKGTVSGRLLPHFIIPLTERFIFDGTDSTIAGEAVRTIGVLLESVDWQQFRTLVKAYTVGVKRREELQEIMLKLVDGASIALLRAASNRRGQTEINKSTEDTEMRGSPAPSSCLSSTIPSPEKLATAISRDILPTLTNFLRDKDDSFVSRRIIVAVTVARLLQMLPEAEFSWRFSALLTDTCNILRSKDQGSRDMARKALATITAMIGASSIGFMITELRRALSRGFLRHVLSYSLHSILEANVSSISSGDLDYCASEVVLVIMEDVFGHVAEEKDAAEYIKNRESKKEIRGRKSFDTMQILAKNVSLQHQVDLFRPLELMLLESLNDKMVRNIDELLRRIGLGLLQNEAVQEHDVLIFCYEIIQDAYSFARDARPARATRGKTSLVSSDYLLKGKMAKPKTSQGLAAMARIGKIVRFSFELLRGVLKKNKELATPQNIEGFMPILGDAVINPEEEIKLAAMRLFTAVITVPLPRIETDAPVFIAEATKAIEEKQGPHNELAQAALKLVSAVLKERKTVKVKDNVVATLLKRMKPELQVISQQGSAFNLLRAILARKIVIPEVYELMDGEDGISAISIRDHDRTTRDLARGVYFAFLMDYPQSDQRFAKQITLLTRNLEYRHAEGRQSVLETLFLLLSKLNDHIVERVIKEVFWPLVSVSVNDDSEDCRQMASKLLQTCFQRATNEWLESFLKLFRKMMENTAKPIQRRTALQCWTLYLEAKRDDASNVKLVMKELQKILADEEGDVAESWQLLYFSLHTFRKVCEIRPAEALAIDSQPIWAAVRWRLLFPQAWVKSEAAKLLGLYLQDFAVTCGKSLEDVPLLGSHGLKLGRDEMCQLLSRHLRLLRDGVSEELADQAKRNLAYLGRFFAANGITWRASLAVQEVGPAQEKQDEDQSEEEEVIEVAQDEEQLALTYLFNRLATILRKEWLARGGSDGHSTSRKQSLIPRAAALDLLTALCASLPPTQMNPSLDSILLPLVHLTDPTATRPFTTDEAHNEAHKKLLESAESLLSSLQSKMGTTEYVAALQRVRTQMKERREERRRKRKIEAIAEPERFERAKVRKREGEKIRRKERGLLMMGRRRGW